MSECCNDCVFYKPKQENYTCGTCDYPVPEWLRTGSSGGNFICNEHIIGASCATFKSRIEIVDEATLQRDIKENQS